MQKNQNLFLESSSSSEIINIHDFFSLKRYIEDTTDFTIQITKNKYFKNRVKTVKIVNKSADKAGFNDLSFTITGKKSISSALSLLAKKVGFSIIYAKDLSDNIANSNGFNNNLTQSFRDKDVSYNGHSVSDFLNYIEENFDVYADIDFNKKIISIKKYKTNMFNLVPLNYKTVHSVTGSGVAASSGVGSTGTTGNTGAVGSSSAGTAGGAGNTVSDTQSYETNVVASIKENLEKMLIKNNNTKIIFNTESGEVFVRTTRKNMSNIKKFIEKINKIYSKQLEVTISIYEFVLNRDFNFGTDVSIATEHFDFTTSTLIDSILKGTFVNDKRKFALNSDNKFLRYAKSYSYKQTFTNNISNSITVQNLKDYVKSITSTTVTNTATTTASNTQVASVNQGININILPRVIGNKISLKTDMQLNSLNKFASNTDAAGNTILLPDQDTKSIPSQIIIKSGERRLIGAYEDYQDTKSYNGVAPIEDFIIGGNSGKQFVKKEILVVLSAKIID